MWWGQNFKKSIRVRQERGNSRILVWYAEGLPRADYQNQYNRPEKDTPVRVRITGLVVDGQKREIEYTVRFIDPNAKHSSGWSALMYAAYYGHAKIVRALDRAGADRSYAKQKWTAARLAEIRGHKQIAAYLKRGQPTHRGIAPAPTGTARTPLLAPPGPVN